MLSTIKTDYVCGVIVIAIARSRSKVFASYQSLMRLRDLPHNYTGTCDCIARVHVSF